MKIFLIGWFGAGNLGDEAILISELIFLKKAIPDCEFHILSFDPDRTSRLIADIPEVKKILRIGAKQNAVQSDFLGRMYAVLESPLLYAALVAIDSGGILAELFRQAAGCTHCPSSPWYYRNLVGFADCSTKLVDPLA